MSELSFKPVKYSRDDLGARLIESITMGLYSRPLHAIREYVQNEIDPYPKPTRVAIRLEANSLSVYGDGKGMDEDDVALAKKVGISDKNPVDNAGFRGIGIWSGVAIADEIRIETKKGRSPRILYLKINAKGIRNEIRSNIPLETLLEKNVELARSNEVHSKEQLQLHYTHVLLKDVIPQVRESDYWSEDAIRQYLSDVLPVDFEPTWVHRQRISKELEENVLDYRVYSIDFQGKPIFRPPYPSLALDVPKTGVLLNERRQRIGFYWFALNKERKKIEDNDFPRIIFKKQGFSVGDRWSCVSFFQEHLLAECTGEIHVVDPAIIPDSERMDFESSLEKETLTKLIKAKLVPLLEEEVRKRSYQENLSEAIGRIDELALRPSKVGSVEEQVEVQREIDKLEGSLSDRRFRREWTPEPLKQARIARIPVIRKLRRKFSSQKPVSLLSVPQVEPQESKVVKETKTSEGELPLIEMVGNLRLRSQTRMIIVLLDNTLTELVAPDLRIKIKSRIIEELSHVIKVK